MTALKWKIVGQPQHVATVAQQIARALNPALPLNRGRVIVSDKQEQANAEGVVSGYRFGFTVTWKRDKLTAEAYVDTADGDSNKRRVWRNKIPPAKIANWLHNSVYLKEAPLTIGKRLQKLAQLSKDQKAYRKLFQQKLKKYKVKSPTELDKDTKKKFFEEVDKSWKADEETD